MSECGRAHVFLDQNVQLVRREKTFHGRFDFIISPGLRQQGSAKLVKHPNMLFDYMLV